MDFSVGGQVWVQAIFKNALDEYVDPANPSVDILMPNGTVYISAAPKKMTLGAYNFRFDVPYDATLGEWTARWTALIDGQFSISTETFNVVPVGQGTSGRNESDENLIITQMLLAREGKEIVLLRPPAPTSDGEGGTVVPAGDLMPLAAQTMVVSGVTRDSDYRQSSYIVADEGERFINRFVVIGMPYLNIKQGDEFDWQGHRIKIDMVHTDRRWQAKAEGERVTNADG